MYPDAYGLQPTIVFGSFVIFVKLHVHVYQNSQKLTECCELDKGQTLWRVLLMCCLYISYDRRSMFIKQMFKISLRNRGKNRGGAYFCCIWGYNLYVPPNRIHFLRFLYRMSRFIVAAKLFIYGDFLKNTKKQSFSEWCVMISPKLTELFSESGQKFLSVVAHTHPNLGSVALPLPGCKETFFFELQFHLKIKIQFNKIIKTRTVRNTCGLLITKP